MRPESEDNAKSQALADEFSKAIFACVTQAFDGEITIESIAPISDGGLKTMLRRTRIMPNATAITAQRYLASVTVNVRTPLIQAAL